MKRRIAKYLKSKEESQYSKLDYILSLYLSGSLSQIINKYDFLKIEIFTEKLYNGFGLQVRFCYFNLTVIIDFFDLDFEFIIYEQDEPIESIEENTTILKYKDDFNIVNFFDKFYIKLKNDKRLNKKVYEVSQKKKLEYKRISIFLLLPFIISILSIVTLVIISTLIDIPFRVPLFIALISISFVLYFIYFYFANKSK